MGTIGWFWVTGLVLCALAVAATLVRRLPLSTSMLYLALGWALGPHGAAALSLDLVRDAALLEQVARVAILVSLFSAGLKLRMALTDPLWRVSLRLTFVSMALTALGIAAAGMLLLGMAWPLALLLGAILAPTDPVLASDVQVDNPLEVGALRAGLTSEAGLNDGTAGPLVRLALLVAAGPLGSGQGWRWLALDVGWGTVAGLAVGALAAAAVGRLVIHLRRVHRHALGFGFFLAPGLIALSYAAAEAVGGNAFLAVFACAVALRRIELREERPGRRPRLPLVSPDPEERLEAAANPATAPLFLVETLLQFTNQLEQVAELVMATAVGVLLGPDLLGPDLWLLPLLLLAIRPAAVLAGLAGSPLGPRERALTAWFGIRGIGSLYYLAYALQQGLPGPEGQRLARIVVAAIAASVLAHGISVTPLMRWYGRVTPPPAPSR